MRDLFLLADEIQSFCQVRGWRFCFIGGIALQRRGEPRLTGDKEAPHILPRLVALRASIGT